MAEKTEKKINRKNSVHIVGYLKENTLEQVSTNEGENAIRGNLIIATDDLNSHKVQFYVSETNKDGETSEDYTKLVELLPDKTTSIADFLKNNPGATFEMAKNASTKVWAQARFEEYVSSEGERTTSMITIKGYKAGLKTASDSFNPSANFTMDIFIKEVVDEVIYADENDETGTPTGRVIVKAFYPAYNEVVHYIDFVAPVEDGVAAYLKANYKPTQTATVNGIILSLQEQIKKENADEGAYFGRPNETQYQTKFVRERRILGGTAHPLDQGAEGCITNDEIKAGLAKRATKAAENGKRAKEAKAKAAAQQPKQEAPKTQAPSNPSTPNTPASFSDVDFSF